MLSPTDKPYIYYGEIWTTSHSEAMKHWGLDRLLDIWARAKESCR